MVFDSAETARSRHKEITRYVNSDVAKAIEFGPLASPILIDRSIVRYVDYCTRDELVSNHLGQSKQFLDNIVSVDFVWNSNSLSDVLRNWSPIDLVIASHVIEHIPNPVGWLQEIAKVVNPNCVVSLVIPNKEQTFDFLRPKSTIGDVLDAHYNNLTRPKLCHVIDQRYYAVRYKGSNSWSQYRGVEHLDFAFADKSVIFDFIDRWVCGEYLDSHCWVFTPDSFKDLMEALVALEICSFEIIDDVVDYGHEFIAHLRVIGSEE